MNILMWFIVLTVMTRAFAQTASIPIEPSRKSAPANSAAGIEGTVVQHSTTVPIRGVRVSLRSIAHSQNISHTTVSDGDGRFAFKEVKPGEYMLYAEKAGFLRQYYGASKPLRSVPISLA